MAVPRLGLADAQWETLCGLGPEAPFDAIIHNGAMVHWVYDYGRLCGPNVQGTLSLLTALAHSSAPMRFTYVSALQPGSDTVPDGDAGYPDDPSLTVGYTPTKYVSETLISRFAKQRAGHHAVAIVRPGLMIGSPTDGIANTDDVIWRTVAAALEIGAYNGDER